jgi:fructoselysine-6-P-deglycase FrlB-like protein
VVRSDTVVDALANTALWADAVEMPEALDRTLVARDGFRETAAFLGGHDVTRIVATGNGASYYVAHALWLSSLRRSTNIEVVAVPAGFLAGRTFEWRAGDRLLAISSSGELRDIIDITSGEPPLPFVLVTSEEHSTLASDAAARALVYVKNQRAVTHTQAYLGNLVTVLALWADLTEDRSLSESVARAPELCADALDGVESWLPQALELVREPLSAVAFGSGLAWAAAREAALLLKELTRIPAEGAETREGATSASFGLSSSALAFNLSADDTLAQEAESTCRSMGAMVVRAPQLALRDEPISPVGLFPTALALAGALSVNGGHDVDNPAWAGTYLAATRVFESDDGHSEHAVG